MFHIIISISVNYIKKTLKNLSIEVKKGNGNIKAI